MPDPSFLAEVLIGEMVLNFMFGMKINFGLFITLKSNF